MKCIQILAFLLLIGFGASTHVSSRLFSCHLKYAFSPMKIKMCNKVTNGNDAWRSLITLNLGANKWCKVSFSDKVIQLTMDFILYFPKAYNNDDKLKFQTLVIESVNKYITNREIDGGVVQVNFNFKFGESLIGAIATTIFGKSDLEYNIQDDDTLISKIKGDSKDRSTNLEFLIGAGILLYAPVSYLTSHKNELKKTILHEMGHSIMASLSTVWSLTHKGTSTWTQKALTGLPSDNDILTYAPKSGEEKLLDNDLRLLILSCV